MWTDTNQETVAGGSSAGDGAGPDRLGLALAKSERPGRPTAGQAHALASTAHHDTDRT